MRNQGETTKNKVFVAMSPHKFLRDSAGQAGGRKRGWVVIAMSGGVDSSVAAALLKKQGYQVIGVFMRFWHESQIYVKKEDTNKRNTCCSEGAEQAARDVAVKLDIPFYVLRLEKQFKKSVVDYFLAEEKKGRTPNPCVVCNKKIKFGLLFKKAMEMGADFVATGHYVRLWRQFPISNFQFTNKIQISNPKFQTKLFCAKDEEKDQSYFLYTLSQQQLSRVLFPIGDYKKEQVYAMAKKWKLPYREGESFDLCFVANNRENFIKKYLKMKPGKIFRHQPFPTPLFEKERENILGGHAGLGLYTIGQRKNIPVQQGPWWVVKKDEKKNILYISNNEKDLYSKELVASNINWLGGTALSLPINVLAKIRYKIEAAEAILQITNRKSQIVVKFKKPQRAITPGQSVVFCRRTGELLGGGTINS